jgi:preprotein translocase subunit SecG
MTMIGLPCLAAGFLMSLIAILFVLSALALIFIILLQRGKGGGLTAALGGGMASGLLGAKTGDVLTWVTISLVGVFLFLAVLMAKYYRPTTGQYGTTPQPATRQTSPVAPADQNAAPASIPGPNAPTQ